MNAVPSKDEVAPPIVGTQADLDRRRLRWRARRGLLENDLILTRFLDRNEAGLDEGQREMLLRLLELPDTELFDLLMERIALAPALDCAAMREILEQLRGV